MNAFYMGYMGPIWDIWVLYGIYGSNDKLHVNFPNRPALLSRKSTHRGSHCQFRVARRLGHSGKRVPPFVVNSVGCEFALFGRLKEKY